MLTAAKVIAHGNTVVIEDDDIWGCDKAEDNVTLLNCPRNKTEKPPVDWDCFIAPSERGEKVDEYMKEMRENDQL